LFCGLFLHVYKPFGPVDKRLKNVYKISCVTWVAVRLCQQDLLTICRQFVVKSCQQALLGFCYQFALRFRQQDLPAKHERIANIVDANLLPSFDQICRQFAGNLRANCLLGYYYHYYYKLCTNVSSKR